MTRSLECDEICGYERRQRVRNRASRVISPRWLGVGENQCASPQGGTRTGACIEPRSIFPVAAAAKQKRRVFAVALRKKPHSVNYFGPITAHNKDPDESHNTSSCRGINPVAHPAEWLDSRWESTRGATKGKGRERRFCFYLICPERERAMGDEAVASAAISWDPSRILLVHTQKSCRVIDAWSSRRGYLSSSFSFSSSSFVSSLSFLLSFSSSSCPSCRSFSTVSFLFTAARRYIYRTTKLIDLGLAISSTQYPDLGW